MEQGRKKVVTWAEFEDGPASPESAVVRGLGSTPHTPATPPDLGRSECSLSVASVGGL